MYLIQGMNTRSEGTNIFCLGAKSWLPSYPYLEIPPSGPCVWVTTLALQAKLILADDSSLHLSLPAEVPPFVSARDPSSNQKVEGSCCTLSPSFSHFLVGALTEASAETCLPCSLPDIVGWSPRLLTLQQTPIG